MDPFPPSVSVLPVPRDGFPGQRPRTDPKYSHSCHPLAFSPGWMKSGFKCPCVINKGDHGPTCLVERTGTVWPLTRPVVPGSSLRGRDWVRGGGMRRPLPGHAGPEAEAPASTTDPSRLDLRG